MASTTNKFEQVFITYRDIKEAHPTWSDKSIEDYLSFKRDLSLVGDVGDDIQSQIDVINLEITDLQDRVSYLESLIPLSVLTAVDYNVAKNSIITCTNSSQITITMPIAPVDQLKVSVKRADGEVVVDGNGKLIDEEAAVTLSRKYVGLTFVYNLVGDTWSII